MAAIRLAILGKNNEPLFIREFEKNAETVMSEEELFGIASKTTFGGTTECSTRQQFILHSALDRYEQLAGPPPGFGWRKNTNNVTNGGPDGMFVGLLCPVEEMRVYGYVTSTKIKFFLAIEDDAVPEIQQTIDNEVKTLLVSNSYNRKRKIYIKLSMKKRL